MAPFCLLARLRSSRRCSRSSSASGSAPSALAPGRAQIARVERRRHHHRRPRPRRAARRRSPRTTPSRAVLLRINSPGGTTAGSEALFASLRRDRRRRSRWWRSSPRSRPPAAMSRRSRADHIVARGNTLTGSIGVIMEYPDLTGVMDRRSASSCETVRSSRAQGRALAVPADQSGGARASTRRLVAESYQWFRGLVGERRGLEGAGARRGGERAGLHRTARARERTCRRDRRRARGAGLARIARRRRSTVCRCATGRSSGSESLGWLACSARSAQAAGFSGKYRFGPAPKLYSIAP